MVTIFKTAKGALIAGDIFCFLKIVFVFPTFEFNTCFPNFNLFPFSNRFYGGSEDLYGILEVLVKNYEQGKKLLRWVYVLVVIASTSDLKYPKALFVLYSHS